MKAVFMEKIVSTLKVMEATGEMIERRLIEHAKRLEEKQNLDPASCPSSSILTTKTLSLSSNTSEKKNDCEENASAEDKFVRVQSKKVTQRRTLADQDTSGHKGLWG